LSTLDFVFLILGLCSISIFAAMGVTRAVGLALGVGLALVVVAPILVGRISEVLATILEMVMGLIGNQSQVQESQIQYIPMDKGLARGLALGLVVLIGLILGGWLGSVLTLPFKIIPGLNLLNTLGGASLGLLVSLLLVGATYVIISNGFPTWSQAQMEQSTFISTFVANGLGDLILIVVPSEWKQVSLPQIPLPLNNSLNGSWENWKDVIITTVLGRGWTL
jgi:hypothetical protein